MQERFEDIWKARDIDVVCVLTNGTVLPDGRNIMGGGIAAQAAAATSYDLALDYGQSIAQYGHTLRGAEHWWAHNKQLLMFPTKYTIYDQASLGLIEKSFTELKAFSHIYPTKRIGLPRPGAGLGGLDWDTEVKPLLDILWDWELEDRIFVFGYAKQQQRTA